MKRVRYDEVKEGDFLLVQEKRESPVSRKVVKVEKWNTKDNDEMMVRLTFENYDVQHYGWASRFREKVTDV